LIQRVSLTSWGVEADLEGLETLPFGLLRRLLRAALTEVPGAQPDAKSLESLARLVGQAAGEGQITGPGFQATRSFRRLLLRSPDQPWPPKLQPQAAGVPSAHPCPPFGQVLLEVSEKDTLAGNQSTPGRSLYNEGSDFVDRDRVAEPLVLRSWRPGDRAALGDGFGEERLKSLFQKQRIPSWQRPWWPILLSGGRIVWAGQFGVARWAAVTEATTRVERIRWIPASPDLRPSPWGVNQIQRD
jgi:tRNA(Ile)-lysidine synthetase-like protein